MKSIKEKFSKFKEKDLGRLYIFFLPYKFRILLASVFLIFSALTSSVAASLLGKMTEEGFYGNESWLIWGAPLGLLLVTASFAVCSIFSSYILATVTQSVLVTLRLKLFKNILNWPIPQYQTHTTGLITSKFVNEATMALSGAVNALAVLIKDSVQVFSLLCLIFWTNWQLSLVVMLVAPALVFVLRKISKRVKRITSNNQTALGSMISQVQESYGAEKLIKIFGTYSSEEKKFDQVNNTIRKLTLKNAKMSSLATPLTQILTMIAIALVVGVAFIQANNGTTNIADFVTFLSALLLLKPAIQHLAGLNGTIASIDAAATSIFSILDTEEEKDEGKVKLGKVNGEIVFENVSLKYPGKDTFALRKINLKINPGEHIALVGTSGSGKTSLVNLITKFWLPTQGNIYLDGIDLNQITLSSLRDNISIVSQDTYLFNDSIKNNIVYGLDSYSEEDLNKVIEAAALCDFISSLPNGLDSPVGENGKFLSGGQRQRISIARALLKNAPIVIFDEATSALDSQSEAVIKQAMDNLFIGKTLITIAHRFSSIAQVDKIYVFSLGELIESGTMVELINNRQTFFRLLEIQKIPPISHKIKSHEALSS